MVDNLDAQAIALGATLDTLQARTDALTASTDSFAGAMTRAFTQATAGGLALDDVLKGLALRISSLAVTQAFRPIAGGITSGLGDLFSGGFGGGGGGFTVATTRQVGTTREPRGGPAPSINVHVTTPDLASFRRSETYLSGQIARAVARGQRGL